MRAGALPILFLLYSHVFPMPSTEKVFSKQAFYESVTRADTSSFKLRVMIILRAS